MKIRAIVLILLVAAVAALLAAKGFTANPSPDEYTSKYKIQYIPTTYFLDSAGNITFDYVGVIQMDEMRAKLNALTGEG